MLNYRYPNKDKRNPIRRVFYIMLSVLSVSIICVIIVSSLNALEKNAIYYNKKGWEYLKKGEDFRAIINFRNALKKNPRFKESIIGLGYAYLETEAYTESFKLFNSALKIDKNNSKAIIGLGFAMNALGKYNDAMKYFEIALKISEENNEAKYGIAHLYYLMDRFVWSKRRLKDILHVNPYHYKSLLLIADIKTVEGRLDEAREYAQKAIESNAELPDAYVKKGFILLSLYKRSNDPEYIDGALEEFNRALSINSEDLLANRSMGYLSILKDDPDNAVKYFQKSLSVYPNNGISLYNLAVAYDKGKNIDKSIQYFVKAMRISPSDSMIQSRLEDFLILNNYKTGHPLRVMLSEEHYRIALEKKRKNLIEDVVLHFRRSLFLNPLKKETLEGFKDTHYIRNYYRFYIDELKNLLKIYNEGKYQEKLKVAVIKRRDRLYHKAGYSRELPPRDVPRILILNLWSPTFMTTHIDAGEVISNYLTFVFRQFGRMETIGFRDRIEISNNLKVGRIYLEDNLEELAEMVKKGQIDRLDYIIYGSFREGINSISVRLELLDFHRGVVISELNFSESGRESLAKLSLRVAKNIYEAIPYKGRVLKIDEEKIIVNLGLYDGVRTGDLLFVEQYGKPDGVSKLNLRKKIIFVIDESDTLMSSAKARRSNDIKFVDINDIVFPLKKRRAMLIR